MGECVGKWLQYKETPIPAHEVSNGWSQYSYYLQKSRTNLKGYLQGKDSKREGLELDAGEHLK